MNIYGGETVDVGTVRRWVCCFQNGDGDVIGKPRSGRSNTATNEENETRLDKLIKSNRRTTVNKISTELVVNVGAVEKFISSLRYSKICA